MEILVARTVRVWDRLAWCACFVMWPRPSSGLGGLDRRSGAWRGGPCASLTARAKTAVKAKRHRGMLSAGASINAHAGGYDWRCPFIDFAFNETSEILRRRLIVGHDLRAESLESITHCRRVHCLQCGIM
jgi:hypothetical protein